MWSLISFACKPNDLSQIVGYGYDPEMDHLDKKQWRRVQALTDFRQSLSALTFFFESPERMNRVDRKRYRCYQDAAIISYCRPFTRSNGLPKLSLETVLTDISLEEMTLHTFLISERDKVVAHTDVDRMRLLLTSFEVLDGIKFPQIVTDEGFALIGKEHQFEAWLHKLIAPLATEVFHLMQEQEPRVEFRQDHLASTLSTAGRAEGESDRTANSE